MYLIINKDGSIKKAVSEEFIQQGSNNVNFVDFAIEGREVSSWTADCVFTLPDETTIRLNGVQQEFTYSGKTYLGYRVYLTSAVLTFSGLIKITARAYNGQGGILYTFPFTQMVNPTMDNNEATPPDISEEQYNSIMALLATYITSYDPHLIRKYDTMENALNDIANIPTSEHILISNGTSNYEMYYKPTSTSSAFSKVPAPTNWSDIYDYTGLSLNDLSNLSLTTIKGYIDKYDIKKIDTNLLTGIFTTGLTLKDLTTLTSSVDFKTLFYTKNEVYSKTEADNLFIKGEETLINYLTKTDAANIYLSKENAENTYLSKENASRDYLTKQGASSLYLTDTQIGLKYDTIANVKAKNDAQDALIENAQSRADAAYNLANSKANTFVFNTYAAMEEDLKSSTKNKYHLGDTLLLKENNTPDYWISAILDTNTGDYGYYEVSELETKIDLSEYQTKVDNTLETTSKTIVGAINENKGVLATKQASVDNSLSTTNKTITGAINEVNQGVSDLDTSKQNKNDNSLSTTSKNIVGAINEVEGITDTLDVSKQNKNDNALTTTNKTIVGAINELKSDNETQNANILNKQDKHSVDLTTTSKEIVGAINENKESIGTLDTKINTVEGEIPTKNSQLQNDKNYIDKSVDDLTHYTTTTALNTLLNGKANRSEIPTDNLQLANGKNYVSITDFASDTQAGVVKAIPTDDISGLASVYIRNGVLYARATEVPVLSFEIVSELPTIGENGIIYFVPTTNPESNNNYIEYIWIGSGYEELGATQLDLSSYATIDYVDNQISLVNANFNNYYNKTSIDNKLSAKFNTSDFNATNIVSTLGTNAVNRATSDSLGNNIGDTYATKSALSGKLDSNANAIITTLGNNAVNKANRAVEDENGNNIASTYQKSAFIINGSVLTNGDITFSDLIVSDLLNAITNKQRIVFVPSVKTYPSIDLNAQKISDNEYALKGSCAITNDTNITIYSGAINVNATTATGTYKSGLANNYVLPKATATQLGGVKIGEGVNINNGTISVATPKIAIDMTNLLESGVIGTGSSDNATILNNTGWIKISYMGKTSTSDKYKLYIDDVEYLPYTSVDGRKIDILVICSNGTKIWTWTNNVVPPNYSYKLYGLK